MGVIRWSLQLGINWVKLGTNGYPHPRDQESLHRSFAVDGAEIGAGLGQPDDGDPLALRGEGLRGA